MIRDGKWIKIALFVLGALVLAGVAFVMLDPGLGKPDEARRVKHPAGFSFVPPRGWGATVFYAGGEGEDVLRVAPERSTGRQPSIGVTYFHRPQRPEADARPYTFQGLPAFHRTIQRRDVWTWQLRFERDGRWFGIDLQLPLVADVEGGPFMPFLNTFRVEQRSPLAPPLLAPDVAPATIPSP